MGVSGRPRKVADTVSVIGGRRMSRAADVGETAPRLGRRPIKPMFAIAQEFLMIGAGHFPSSPTRRIIG